MRARFSIFATSTAASRSTYGHSWAASRFNIASARQRKSRLPAPSPDALSKDLKKRGFKFVGSTIIYAHMQATGMVNDHLVSCFGYGECKQLGERR